MHKHRFLLDKRNFTFIFAGIGLMVLGFILMMGGASSDPNVYPEEVVYGFQRTVLAPALILLGLAVQVYAIMLKPSDMDADTGDDVEQTTLVDSGNAKAVRKPGKR